MNLEEFRNFTIRDYHALFARGELSPSVLLEAFFRRIEEVDPLLHAFLFVNRENALERARRLEKEWKGRDLYPPLWGIPVAVKDNICTLGIPTTCGSKILEGFIPPYNATVIERLERAGAIIIGKTNMDEFAMGSSTENSAFGPTRNPFDLNRVPGGSSGGSAAAVAAFEAPVALGSDTGGSVRQPAAFCGIVGLRPTYGRVSRYGLVSFASSLDQIGPMTRTVEDAITLFEVISGKDERDSTCAPYPPFSREEIPPQEDIRTMKIGLPREYFSEGVDPRMVKVITAVLRELEKEGLELVEVSLPHTNYALEAYYIVAPSEASSNLARYDGVLYGMRKGGDRGLQDMYFQTRSSGFGPEVKRRILLGTYSLSSGYYDAYYLKGMKVRTLVRRDFEEAFATCHLLVTPVSPVFPFFLGERTKSPYEMYLADVFTIPSAMAGVPSIAMNCGYEDGLPVGMQIIAGPFQERVLFALARFVEQMLSLPLPFPEIGPERRT
uniref:Glutamyl-tRNA(Gln) amidotransferase subunit A n=1 Tax=Candidatus Caldatribacterium californiense TaxID=1454726 RepID=A0A7V3YK03_9BACT